MARDLVEHVVEERDAGGEARLAAAVEVEGHLDLGLLGVALDFGLAHWDASAEGGGECLEQFACSRRVFRP